MINYEKCGTGKDAIEKGIGEMRKMPGREQFKLSPHVWVSLEKRKGFNSKGEEIEGTYGGGYIDPESFEGKAITSSFGGQGKKKIIEHTQPRAALLVMGGQAYESNIDSQTKEAHINLKDLDRLLSFYSSAPQAVQAFYEKAGGEGEIKLRLHLSQEELDNIENELVGLNLPDKELKELKDLFKSNYKGGTVLIEEELLGVLAGRGGKYVESEGKKDEDGSKLEESQAEIDDDDSFDDEEDIKKKEDDDKKKKEDKGPSVKEQEKETESTKEATPEKERNFKIKVREIIKSTGIAMKLDLNYREELPWLDNPETRATFIRTLDKKFREGINDQGLLSLFDKELKESFPSLNDKVVTNKELLAFLRKNYE